MKKHRRAEDMDAEFEDLRSKIGTEIGVSSWLNVAQDRIDAFAEVTEDWQYIHIDKEKAASSAFGGTIAHGLLTLALLPRMAAECLPRPGENSTGVNYGFDQVRFLSPVPSGAQIRGRFVLEDCIEMQPGTHRLITHVTVDIKDHDKPALVAKWHTLRVASAH
jgi:acyl dehydratase